MIDWAKLRREWKTLALALVGIVIESYDALAMSGTIDLPGLLTPWLGHWGGPALLVGMLLLRKWKDSADA
jgi:hypothetical protein